MGQKLGAIGNSLGEHVKNLGTFCFPHPLKKNHHEVQTSFYNVDATP
jgi:hypothetical protein